MREKFIRGSDRSETAPGFRSGSDARAAYPVRALRHALKRLRDHGLRVTTIREQHAAHDCTHRQSTENRHGRRRERVTRSGRRVPAADRGYAETARPMATTPGRNI